MSLFKKSAPSPHETDEKWKQKYLDLLNELEDVQKNFLDEHDLLRKTIIRLSLATKGLDPELDPHLQKIQTQLKSGLKGAQLRTALDEFSNAILKLNSSITPSPVIDLTPFYENLIQLYPKLKDPLSVLQFKHQKKNVSNTHEIINEILDTLTIIHPTPIVTPPHESPQLAKNTLENALIIDELSIQLSQLLNTLDIPAQFESRATALKEKLHATPSVTLFKSALDEYIQLFLEINKFLQAEQKEMANFLSGLTDQLAQLSLKASGASYAAELSAKKRNLLDESVSAQMSDLQQRSSDAATLEPLKQLIKSRLVNIRNEIQEHVKNEELLRQETEKQLDELTNKIHSLDAESTELKTKLTAAHNNATRDSLTSLPNRRAYEEAISIEIARWQRNKTPLTMALWDIDFFKKINDTYGHKAGDKTLVIIASILTKYCRKTDFIARLGGEEFIMLLPNTKVQSALTLANKLRLLIEKAGLNAGGQKINITISCGLSEFIEGDTGESVFERADKALYQSKANGRNQCTIL